MTHAFMQSMRILVDVATNEEIERLAADLGTTVGETVALAVRRLRQERMGVELAAPLRDDEMAWLAASSGDVVEFDPGPPVGREAGFGHPAVVVTAR